MLDGNSEPQPGDYVRASDIQPEELISFISLPHYELHKLINDPGISSSIQKTSLKKSPNSTTKPKSTSKNPSSRRPSSSLTKLKRFFNMQRVVEKILIVI
jgi:hypothetical protein